MIFRQIGTVSPEGKTGRSSWGSQMETSQESEIKYWLLKSLSMTGAHAPLEDIVGKISATKAGRVYTGTAHSPYQILEHITICLRDMLDYCREEDYELPDWPSDFWVENPEHLSQQEWLACLNRFQETRREFMGLVGAEESSLFDRAPAGKPDHILFRQAIIMVDHIAYHLGQLSILASLPE